MSMTDGKDAEQAFEDHWLAVGHVQRLRDKRDLIGINGGNTRIKDFPKPADFLVSSRDIPLHYAEVKSTHGKVGFGFSGIRDAQHNAAIKEIQKGSGHYVFYIFSYHLGKWFMLTGDDYAKLVAEGKKSVKFKELNQWNR